MAKDQKKAKKTGKTVENRAPQLLLPLEVLEAGDLVVEEVLRGRKPTSDIKLPSPRVSLCISQHSVHVWAAANKHDTTNWLRVLDDVTIVHVLRTARGSTPGDGGLCSGDSGTSVSGVFWRQACVTSATTPARCSLCSLSRISSLKKRHCEQVLHRGL